MWCEKMKKSVTKLIANILSVVLLVVLCLNFSPFLGERINGISSLLASASSPDSILTDKKSNISADNLKPKTDNTTTASDDARQAMHAIILKDSACRYKKADVSRKEKNFKIKSNRKDQ